ncbi:lysophospholipid acyltransferase family protein [Thermomicrobium sp. 4228-Ro]|uniref:lysophospholipid acyltransferase family protein n=1 Tax=Thermomicrobium sp. 4228-Ro TaxID=2993937 RepID=UPI0022487661|nr:lysophospholipid acyltransferase family protein [Thermomicrobium sp. 4228-Ro]MCX2726230.1 lysophospholipid acyltransferase family protein [Thermomicrobium sp. 4228-Ro]
MSLLWALRIGALLTLVVPVRLGYWLCRLIGITVFLVHRRARRNVLENLHHVCPRCSAVWRYRQAARVFITAVMNYYDLVRLRSVDRDRLRDLVEVRGWEHVETALSRGRGVIVISAHLGNFNVVAQYPAALGFEAAIVVERVRPARLFAYLCRLRSATGVRVLPSGPEAVPAILRLLRRNGILLVAGDRDVTGHSRWVRFFDAPAPLPIGPVALALRTGATLLPAFTIRLSTRRSLVVVDPPLELIRTGDHEHDIVANLETAARCLERMIRTDPGQWTVLQPIWAAPQARTPLAEALGSVPLVEHAPGEQDNATQYRRNTPES